MTTRTVAPTLTTKGEPSSLSVPASVAKHTRAPWVAECIGVTDAGPNGQDVYEILSADGYARICEGITTANAARIVAAVNFCEGFANHELAVPLRHAYGFVPREECEALRAQRDELAAFLSDFASLDTAALGGSRDEARDTFIKLCPEYIAYCKGARALLAKAGK